MRETRRFEKVYDGDAVEGAIDRFRDELPEGAQIVDLIRWDRERFETTIYGEDFARYTDTGFRVWADVSVPVEQCDFCGHISEGVR